MKSFANFIFVGILMLGGCSSPEEDGAASPINDAELSSDANLSEIAEEPVTQLKPSIVSKTGTYVSSNCSANKSSEETCVPEADWRDLCENATGIGSIAKIDATGDIGTTNIDIDDLDIYWNDGKKFKCRYSFSITNNLSGYESTEKYVGAASEIYVYNDDETGELLVSISNGEGWGIAPD